MPGWPKAFLPLNGSRKTYLIRDRMEERHNSRRKKLQCVLLWPTLGAFPSYQTILAETLLASSPTSRVITRMVLAIVDSIHLLILCLNMSCIMHYVGVNVNVAIILEGKRALGELPFVTGFPKSLHQRHWDHLPTTLPHTKGARLNISCFLDYFGGERSPWSDLVFSNKCALCHCSLLRDNTAQAESSTWPLIEHKQGFVRPQVITWTSANEETKH